ncbi:MAG TPA: hypothetical protein VKQ30_24610 [Ktedonobacterales bacterium]|nr:hypothetical protein [Ktedonobacterales bacterium]
MMDCSASAHQARCVALTQEHRGHGVSTAAYYLGRALVAQGLRVLLVDVTGRHQRISVLMARGPVKNLVLWAPALARPQDVAPALDQARRQTAGRADVIVLDIDAALLEHAGGFALGIEYVVAVTEQTEAGQESADHIAERLHDDEPPQSRVGVVFSRVDAAGGELPAQTAARQLPVLGSYPADYLLASGEAYSLKGSDAAWPHDSYLYALRRLGQQLKRIVPLCRTTGLVSMSRVLPHETNGHAKQR